MKYRRLGNTGLIVSELSLGTMQFGGKMNVGNLDQKATIAMIRFALEKGINFIDTADVYGRGESESLVGKALEGIRGEIVLATKARLPMSDSNFNHSGATRVNIMREIEASLGRLKTDYIDLYQIHGWDSNTPLEETVRSLDDLVRQGKVRYIGLSNYLSWQAAAAVELQTRLGLEKYATAQMHYSLVNRGLEYEFQSFAEHYGIGILVWSPLAGGFLTGKYDRDHQAPEGSRFSEAGQFVPFDKKLGYRVVDVLRRIANRHGRSPAQVALAWTLARPAVSSIIIGARRIANLDDDIAAVDLELSAGDVKLLDAASDPGVPYPKWMVLQLDTTEDPRPAVLHPELYKDGGPWKDLRGTKWEG
ncbi:MAG: aldo/keto reductase [Rectinemataceae bacterium]|jgi:aryl-alcohol dehydrogenase-like predicted oxidoreductase